MRVLADQNRCASSGNCADVAPEVFGQDDETGVVVVRDETPSDQERDRVKQAEALCPAQAIRVEG
ncbi:ferredoxin [Amycolatopsis sp. K13G38]|uniref:Ferredoxin n=1 Tax=Amycolatopsis acididurans TaxID=2724524 RepID=A0ABX1J8V4_9PSEU|nr:ferredoxin [Amycolatopsis acididurans]